MDDGDLTSSGMGPMVTDGPSVMSMGMPSSSMASSPMAMTTMGSTFYTSTSTALFTERFKPTSVGSYAGICILLIILAIITRCLMALRTVFEQRQLDRDRKRRYVVVRDRPIEAQRVLDDNDSKEGMLVTARGVEENVKILTASIRPTTAWRFSTDLPRAMLTTVIAGMGYLLMLAVMTFNVGYFLSVLGGIFLGDIAVGRFTAGGGEH